MTQFIDGEALKAVLIERSQRLMTLASVCKDDKELHDLWVARAKGVDYAIYDLEALMKELWVHPGK